MQLCVWILETARSLGGNIHVLPINTTEMCTVYIIYLCTHTNFCCCIGHRHVVHRSGVKINGLLTVRNQCFCVHSTVVMSIHK